MAKVAPLFGDEPWWVRDLARETNTEEQLMRQVLRHAAQQGLIVAIVKDRYYRNDRIVAFANLIRELDQARGSTCAADFRDRLNVGRKLAIQIPSISTASALPAAAVTIICCAIRYYFLKLRDLRRKHRYRLARKSPAGTTLVVHQQQGDGHDKQSSLIAYPARRVWFSPR